MNKKKYHTVGTDKIDTPNTQIHDRLFSWSCTGISVKSDYV
jgi:hypothetical protein